MVRDYNSYASVICDTLPLQHPLVDSLFTVRRNEHSDDNSIVTRATSRPKLKGTMVCLLATVKVMSIVMAVLTSDGT
jgi:hypothetical protein